MQFASFREDGPGGTEEHPELQGRRGELAHQGLGAIGMCSLFDLLEPLLAVLASCALGIGWSN